VLREMDFPREGTERKNLFPNFRIFQDKSFKFL
jgi:hypothetical protein